MKASTLLPFWIFLLATATQGKGEGVAESGRPKYTSGCPDSAKVRQLYSRGHLDEVVMEIESFKRYIRISPKACDVFTSLYYGVSKLALGDTTTGRVAWRAMLKLDPTKEIWDFQLPLFLQARFDGIKRELWRSGAIPNPYAKDYIPATYPDPNDGSELQRLRTLYHNARLNAYLGSYEATKKEIKDYLLRCEKQKQSPDPAILMIKGELMSRYAPADRSMQMQAALSIEAGMEANRQGRSRIVDSDELQFWGERMTHQLMMRTRNMASGSQP